MRPRSYRTWRSLSIWDEAGTSVSAWLSAPVVTLLTNQGPLSNPNTAYPEARRSLACTRHPPPPLPSQLEQSRQLCPNKKDSQTPIEISSAHAGPEEAVQSPLTHLSTTMRRKLPPDREADPEVRRLSPKLITRKRKIARRKTT